MDRNTLLAVVLSVIVITLGFAAQSYFFGTPRPPAAGADAGAEPAAEPAETADSAAGTGTGTADAPPPAPAAVAAGSLQPLPADSLSDEPYVFENDIYRVTFDPAGARVSSLRLLEHLDEGQPVELILRGSPDQGAFSLRFGPYTAEPVTALFRRVPANEADTVRFERDFAFGSNGVPFTVIRTYRFFAGEYLFETAVEIRNSENTLIPLDFDGSAYTLSSGPQIGPQYQQLDRRNEYRNFYYYDGNRRRDVRLDDGVGTMSQRLNWAGLSGKYFALLAVPGAVDYRWVFSEHAAEGLPDGHTFHLTRPVIRSAANRDVFRIYAGPKVARTLERYNDADQNALGISNLNLDLVQERRFLFGWLENILKAVMQMIYRVVPNYGIAIIILTILVKLVLFPLTRKGYESTSKMQTLSPKIQELRTKYKDNPQKMNQAMAELYKKEGVNPLGGCLPLGLQMPFFLAMFGVFNNHFDLRGATFIPGWITDLSAPESILSFGSFTLPLLGWNDLRLLPIIFVGSQLLSSKLMQGAAAASSQQQKMMQYGLPIMFFFVLYNMPSGLLVYWIFSNLLTVGQQFAINQRRQHQSAE